MKPTLSADEFNVALLILRVVVGPVFAYHGYAKITKGGKLAGTAAWFDGMGMRPGRLHARAAAFGELATGACITVGFLTSFGGLGLVGLMTVAYWTVHRGKGLLITGGGYEYNLVLGAVGVSLAMLGAGRYSLDHAFGIDINGNVGLGISLIGGLAMAIGLLSVAYHPPAKADGSGS
jgi:putative oxidoreductase